MAQTIQIIGSILLALMPAFIWGYLFYKKDPQNKRLTLITFVVGALAVFPILIYKTLWIFFPWINAFKWAADYNQDIIYLFGVSIPLSVIITFMLVGVIEELMKFFSVKIVDDEDTFKDIDDAMEFFIIAALGFSFTENILYFYNIWLTEGSDNLFLPFLFRSSFSTFAHIMFSGIFGYYYGTAHFADHVLQEEIKEHRHHWTIFLHKIFNWKKSRMFFEERLLEGIIIAVGLHAIFNIFLETSMTFLIVPFLISGYIALDYLFDKKENHKKYGKLLTYERNHPHTKSGVFFQNKKLARS